MDIYTKFVKLFICCVICFNSIMAGVNFSRGDITFGIIDICLSFINFPYLLLDFDDYDR